MDGLGYGDELRDCFTTTTASVREMFATQVKRRRRLKKWLWLLYSPVAITQALKDSN